MIEPPGTVSRPVVGLVMPLASQQGGAEGLFQHLLRAGSRSFRYICLFLQEGPLVAEAVALGYETTVVPTTHLRDVPNYIATVRAIRVWLQNSHVDLVFSWMLKGHLYAGPASMALGIRGMWFQHGLSRRHWMDIASAFLPAEAILCCSSFAQKAQDERFPRHASFACHPGVPASDAGRLTREQARARLGLPVAARVVGMVARLERWKGAHVFIRAAITVAQRHPDTTFFIVGGAHPFDLAYAEEVSAMARVAGLHERFVLAGQQPAADIPVWHASADIVVHPAVQPEPFGMAVVEAMSAGRAVIASNAGGITEIIENGESGLLVSPGDETALSDAICNLLSDTTKRDWIERAAASRARHFSIDTFTKRFETLVSSVMAV